MKFGFNWKQVPKNINLKEEQDPKNIDLDKEVEKTRQHSDFSLSKEQDLKEGEGEMFGNPYSEHGYNVRGHEDEERLRSDSHSPLYEKAFVPIEDVADDSGLGDFENQDLTPGLKPRMDMENGYEKDDFRKRAKSKLDKIEYNTLFSFIDSAIKSDTWRDYLVSKDEYGEIIQPARSMGRDITNLIKKVNSDRPKMVESLENTYNDNGYVTDEKMSKVPVDSIKFKAPQDPKKMLNKN